MRTPVTPTADNTRMAIHKAAFAVSPVFGGLLVFVVVPGISGVGVPGTSLMVTVCPSSLMSLCSDTFLGSSGLVRSLSYSNVCGWESGRVMEWQVI